MWSRLARGCHLRKIDDLIVGGSFRIEALTHALMPGPRTSDQSLGRLLGLEP
jgi:hypothetical protein